MQPEIVLREITGTSADLAELLDASGTDAHAGSDCGAIALRTDQLEEHAVKCAAIGVDENGGWLSHVQQDHVDVAVVEDVAESGAAARFQRQSLQTCFLGSFVESTVAVVAVKKNRFLIAGASIDGIDLRINVPVGDQKIQPGVIVHIEKGRAPADVGIAGL